jgi:hypothetical protein
MRQRCLTIALVCFLSAGLCAQAMCDGFEVGMVAASAADLASTEYSLRTNPRVIEGNPLLRDQGARIAFKLAGTVALVYVYRNLKTRHPTAAKLLAISVIVSWSMLTAWNLYAGATF